VSDVRNLSLAKVQAESALALTRAARQWVMSGAQSATVTEAERALVDAIERLQRAMMLSASGALTPQSPGLTRR
jgi:hypothetical protein